jgi:hypothetical protein
MAFSFIGIIGLAAIVFLVVGAIWFFASKD